MPKEKIFIYSHTKGNIDYYKVNPKIDIYIPAIDLKTGKIEEKKIIEYTYHRNLEMYKIHDSKKRFKDFWVSKDHSLIVWNQKANEYEKISPINIMDNPEDYFLVKKKKENDKEFISCLEIEINYDPEITEAADFTVEDYYTFCNNDGIFLQDTVALYRPLTKRAVQECEEKLWTINNVFSAANGTVQFTVGHGIIYGLYKLTKDEKGKEIFKQYLGLSDDYDLSKPVDKKKLLEIITSECEKGNIEILDKVKTLGFSYTIQEPETLSILDLEPIEIEITGDMDKDYEILEKGTEILKQKFPKKDIVNSGARANWDQVRQMLGSRGYVSDFFGNIIRVPIRKAYAKGLSEYDYFVSCYGARKGILDVAENTAKSGFLTRKMTYAAISSQLDLELDDCGTDLCVIVNVKDEKLAKALVGRYYYKDMEDDTLYCVNNPKEIVGKEIYLRTPLFCESKKICKTCYGKLADIHKSPYVGIIAAQTLGERSTQLVLRTFHYCFQGDTEILDVNNNKIKIKDIYKKVKKGEDVYTFSVSNEGRIVVSKIIDAHKDRYVTKAIKVTLDNGETVICTHDHKWMLRNGEYKEAKDLRSGDSLMPIYIDKNQAYRRVIHNDSGRKAKLIKVEEIELEKGEYFYDLTVDSEFHNFALGCGVFVHNSGVAQGKNLDKQQDIVTDMNTSITSLDKDIELQSIGDAFTYTEDLWRLFSEYGYLHLVHFEVLTAQRLWAELPDRFVRYRTHIKELEQYENYDEDGRIVNVDYKLKLVGIKNIASLESWFLGMIFQNARANFIKGLIHPSKQTTVLEKIVLGQVG